MRPSLCLSLFVLLAACDQPPEDEPNYCETCNLDYHIPLVAAADAIDCGRLAVGEDSGAMVACIEQALADEVAFIAIQNLQGIDSTVALAFVVDADGVVQRLSYDSNICGGAGGCEGDCGPSVGVMVCADAPISAVPGDPLLDCTPTDTTALCEP